MAQSTREGNKDKEGRGKEGKGRGREKGERVWTLLDVRFNFKLKVKASFKTIVLFSFHVMF